MHVTVHKRYNIQNLAMRISGYVYSPTDISFVVIICGMQYLIDNPHEPIMYPPIILNIENRYHRYSDVSHWGGGGGAEIKKT